MKKENTKGSTTIRPKKIKEPQKIPRTTSKLPSKKFENKYLLKKLKLYQSELEMQNEELCRSRDAAEKATEKYKTLYDFSPGGIFSVDATGRIGELNYRTAELLGKERSDLKNENFKLFVADKNLLIFNKFLFKIFSIKGKASCEVLLKANNNPLYVHIEGNLTENGEKCYCFMIDITDKLLNERKIIESEEKFHSIIKNSLDIIAIADENGIIKYTSPSIKLVLGFEENEIVGKNFLHFIHPNDFELIMHDFKNLIERGGGGTINEFRILNKKGNYIYVEAQRSNQLNNPYIKGLITNLRDISDRKENEKQLQIKEKNFRDIFNYSLALICTHDMEGKILTVNPASCHVFKYSTNELLGKNFSEFLPIKDVDNFKNIYLKK